MSDRPNAEHFTGVLLASAEAIIGEPPVGTVLAPTPDRAGSPWVVAYAFGDVTIVWCAPTLAPRLGSLTSAEPIDVETFRQRTDELGGEFVANGRHRVLDRPPASPVGAAPHELRWLDPGDEGDLALLHRFVDACSEDDLDEAELELDDLDDHIVVSLGDDGEISGYASGRPFDVAEDFDDIGVITHPDHRGRRLGALVVAEYCRVRQAAGRRMYYSCDVENLGSNRVAETVGFELVCNVAGSSFVEAD